MRLLDASALLAYLLNESGGDVVAEKLDGTAAISAVNLAEAVLRLQRPPQAKIAVARKLAANPGLTVLPFGQEEVVSLSRLSFTPDLSLSLGDKACLATAAYYNCPVLTADKAWQQLKLPIEVQLIR